MIRAAWLCLVTACGDDSASDATDRDAGSKTGTAPQSGTKTSTAGRAGREDSRAAGRGGSAGSQRTDDAARAGNGAGGTDAMHEDAGESLSVALKFHALLNGEDFACGHNYPNQGASHTEVTPQDLRFYVQDVSLFTAAGTEIHVQLDDRAGWQAQDLALLDFEDATGDCYGNEATNTTITGRVEPGDYTAVAFSVGVPDALNHGNPSSLPAPLHASGMSWSWLLGYRFLKLEVGAVNSADVADVDAGVGRGLVHVGSVGCSGNPSAGTVSCSKPNRNRIRLTGDDAASKTIAFDVGTLLSTLDLSQETSCHSANALCEASFRNFGIDFATGKPADTQKAFKLE